MISIIVEVEVDLIEVEAEEAVSAIVAEVVVEADLMIGVRADLVIEVEAVMTPDVEDLMTEEEVEVVSMVAMVETCLVVDSGSVMEDHSDEKMAVVVLCAIEDSTVDQITEDRILINTRLDVMGHLCIARMNLAGMATVAVHLCKMIRTEMAIMITIQVQVRTK